MAACCSTQHRKVHNPITLRFSYLTSRFYYSPYSLVFLSHRPSCLLLSCTLPLMSSYQCLLAMLIVSVYSGAPEWANLRGSHFKFTVMHDPPVVRNTGCLAHFTAVCLAGRRT